MQQQNFTPLYPPLQVRAGVLVVDGSGISLRVLNRGKLRVEDGIGRQRRSLTLDRAGCGLERLVLMAMRSAPRPGPDRPRECLRPIAARLAQIFRESLIDRGASPRALGSTRNKGRTVPGRSNRARNTSQSFAATTVRDARVAYANGRSAPSSPVACAMCGDPVLKRRRRHCEACMPKARRAHGLRAIDAARKALAAQTAAGNDPRRSAAVNGARGEAISEGHRRNRSWAREHPGQRDAAWFTRDRTEARCVYIARNRRRRDCPRSLLAYPGWREDSASAALGAFTRAGPTIRASRATVETGSTVKSSLDQWALPVSDAIKPPEPNPYPGLTATLPDRLPRRSRGRRDAQAFRGDLEVSPPT